MCRVCGCSQLLEVHHIKFRSRGGPDEAWNLVSLCKKCHGRAHGLDAPTLSMDYLHALVELELFGEPEIKNCRTCAFTDPTFFCRLWDEQFDSTYLCEKWATV